MIGILCPTYWEAARFIRREGLKRESLSTYALNKKDKSLRLEISGIGPDSAQKACEKLIAFNPSVLICCGFAGALRPSLRAGDLVLDVQKSDGQFLNVIQEISLKKNYSCSIGPFWTSTSVLFGGQEKYKVSLSSNAIAVEMEGQAVWEIAQKNGIPFCSLRAISDTLTEEIPAAVVYIDPYGRLRWNFWKGLLESPSQWISFLRLASNSRKAGSTLQMVLSDFIKAQFST